jgi:prepilin-type N-terminal cleavage/methylation domain-containing protein
MSVQSTTRPPRATRRGFTLAEMLIALMLLASVLGVAVRMLGTQTRTMRVQASRLDAQYNAQYAVAAIERELRVAGVGTLPGQPVVVAIAPKAIVFNTNLVSRDPADVEAVYVNADADADAVTGWPATKALPLPTIAGDAYPDTSYARDGSPSRAETVAFWFSRDSTSADATEHVLFRRVNAGTPELVARGILIGSADTVFQYFVPDTLGTLVPLAPSRLPASHTAKLHLGTTDVSPVDSVRLVRIRLKSVSRDAETGAVTRRTEATVRILNAGIAYRMTCGVQPLAPVPSRSLVYDGTAPTVVVSWGPSADENGNEKDVERYVIFRRKPMETTWGEPLGSLPSGLAAYSYTDRTVKSGAAEQWIYGVAAQDCSPQNSTIAATPSLSIP